MTIEYVKTITAEDYNALRCEAGWEKYSQKQMQAAIDGSAYVVAAVDGGKTIAAARLISDGACYGIIADVVVSEKYRGYGVGKKLISEIIEYVKNKLDKDERYRINVMAYKGRDGFYERMGFVLRPNDMYGHGFTLEITGI